MSGRGKKWTPANGCDIRGTDCDTCLAVRRRQQGEEYTTRWISSKAGTDGVKRIRRVTG